MKLYPERLTHWILAVKERLVRGMSDDRGSRRYWQAYEEWKKRDRDLGISLDASQRFTRDQAHER
jgi:hypothetical protein